MPPKPFPYAINVGTDIAHTVRFKRYAENSELLTRWASRRFTQLEWGLIARQCSIYSGKPVAPDFKYLPVPTSDKTGDWHSMAGYGSPTERLATFLAGRWCIKEAVVKAYRGALSMQDISIGPNYWIDGFSPSQSYGLGTHNSYSPIAVVEPPRRPLLIPKELAKQRGLFCGTDTFILAPSEGKKLLKMSQWTVSGEFIDGKFRLSRSDVGQQYYPRRLKRANDNEGREIAKVSLSHDLHFATATCIASETERSYRSETQRRRFMTSSEAFYLDAVLDDGLGEPMHEPRWGDEGWVTPLMHEQYSWKVGRF